MDLGWIWGGSGVDLGGIMGGILALVRTSGVDLGVSGVDLESICPSCAPPPSAKIYRTSIEHLSKINRRPIEILSNIYRTSVQHLSKIYRQSIENLSKSVENLSKIYRKSIVLGSIWGGSGVDLGWIWGGSGEYRGLSAHL